MQNLKNDHNMITIFEDHEDELQRCEGKFYFLFNFKTMTTNKA